MRLHNNLEENVDKEYADILDHVARSTDPYGEAMFWGFCKLRQSAWARKAENLPKPWSGDPIIAEWRFTNLYRELDRGTLYCAEEILEKAPDRETAFYMVALYRTFNRISTWEMLKKWYGTDEVGTENAYKRMYMDFTEHNSELLFAFFNAHHERNNKRKEKLFTGAYSTSSNVQIFYEFKVRDLWKACRIAMDRRTMEGLTLAFFGVDYVGMFSAFQIAMDLCIPRSTGNTWAMMDRKYDPLDNWVAIGPGSKAGSRYVRPDLPAATVVKYLRENQYIKLGLAGGGPFAMPFVNGEQLPMRIIDIEHALCEYAKYRNALEGRRMKSRLVVPPYDWTPSAPVPPGWGDDYGRTWK